MSKQIEIPEKMKHLKLDNRGYPIPYIILVDNRGVPHFKINDDVKVKTALKWKFCAICGKSMWADMWQIGGPRSAFHEHGAYIDTPTHRECGLYALKVCPYLASKHYNTMAPPEKVVNNLKKVDTEHSVFVNPTVDPNKPKLFVFTHITEFKVKRVDKIIRYVIPKRPYKSIEFWINGREIEFEIGLDILEKEYPDLSTENMLSY